MNQKHIIFLIVSLLYFSSCDSSRNQKSQLNQGDKQVKVESFQTTDKDLNKENPELAYPQILNFDDMKILSSKTTAQILFDEAVNISANFSVAQYHKGLKNFFNPISNESELCLPASFAHMLLYKMGITHELSVSELVPGISSDLKSIDANKLIIDLIYRCNTDVKSGTKMIDFLNCIQPVSKAYFNKELHISHIQKLPANDPVLKTLSQENFEFKNQWPNLLDIQSSLKSNIPLLILIGWYEFNSVSNKWERNGGHFFDIYGYNSFKDLQTETINLVTMNALWIAQTSDSESVFDIISVFQNDKSMPIFIEGTLFPGIKKRGFIEAVTAMQPKNDNP